MKVSCRNHCQLRLADSPKDIQIVKFLPLFDLAQSVRFAVDFKRLILVWLDKDGDGSEASPVHLKTSTLHMTVWQPNVQRTNFQGVAEPCLHQHFSSGPIFQILHLWTCHCTPFFSSKKPAQGNTMSKNAIVNLDPFSSSWSHSLRRNGCASDLTTVKFSKKKLR